MKYFTRFVAATLLAGIVPCSAETLGSVPQLAATASSYTVYESGESSAPTQASSVPEPRTVFLLGSGLLIVAMVRRRRA